MNKSIMSVMSDKEFLAYVEPKTPLELELFARLLRANKRHEEILECVKRMEDSSDDDPLGFKKRQAF